MRSPADTNDLLREARAVLHDALDRSRPAVGWHALSAAGPDGNPGPARPYTDRAIAAFKAAHARDPEDIGVVHHLAIAHHARAWELELKGDAAAAGEWEAALGYWHTLASSAPFWDAMRGKLRACDPAADPAPLRDARSNLLEHLLDVHVDFVRQYAEANRLDRATAHVELVRRARVPPALRAKMVGKVFTAMTGRVPEATAGGAFAQVLTPVERFLELFPDHLPAARMHAEVCKEWAAGLSFQTDWDAILSVSGRAEANARRLAATADLARHDPLAVAAVVELASDLVRLGAARARGVPNGRAHADLSEDDRRAVADALAVGLTWEGLAGPFVAPESAAGARFADCLHQQGLLLYREAEDVLQSSVSQGIRYSAAIRLYRRALPLLEKALVYIPDEDALTHNRNLFRQRVEYLEVTRLEDHR